MSNSANSAYENNQQDYDKVRKFLLFLVREDHRMQFK